MVFLKLNVRPNPTKSMITCKAEIISNFFDYLRMLCCSSRERAIKTKGKI